MKKLLVALTLGLSLSANASHVMGGVISVFQTSQDSTALSTTLIFDSQGPPTPSMISIERWEMNSQGWYVLDGYITLDAMNPQSHQGATMVQYISDYVNLDSNKYRFIYKNCCWGMLMNATNSNQSEIVISTDYWHIPNNSTPFLDNPLWINVEQNAVNSMKPVWGTYNCFFVNPDSDSVNLYKSELYSSYSNGVFVPQTQTSTNIAASNDSITFVGTNLGSVGYGFQIDDYRAGQLIGVQRIQWTFIVRNSTVGIKEDIVYRNMQYKVYDWYGRYLGTSLGNQKGFLILRYTNGKVEKIFIQ